MKTKITLIAAAALLTGCAITTNVKPVSAKLDQVCIERNAEVRVDDLLGVIESNFKRRGVETKVYDTSPAPCLYRVTYTASRRWDVTLFLSDAEILLLRDKEVIGRAEYHLPAGILGGGGANPDKWRGTAFKIDPLMDQMLASVGK